MTEYISDKKGYSTLILRLAAYAVTIAGIALTFNGQSSIESLNYLSWIAYPIFAYLIAMGYDYSSNKLKYFVRLLLFSLIAEIPYNFYTSGSILNIKAQNGMLTLTLGMAVLCIVSLIHKKLNNVIIDGACCYGLGYGAYWLAKHYNFEFYSFGIMIIIMFYISRQVKYSKILQWFFFGILTLAITSETSINIIVGSYQYSFPYRILGFIALILIAFSNEKRGPNSLALKISMYCFYPVVLSVAALLKIINK